MQTLTENDIDELCEVFEESWCIDTAGAGGVATFMTQKDIQRPADTALVCSLAEVDIERSWMAWAKRIDSLDPRDMFFSLTSNSSTQTPCSELVASLRSMVAFTDYASFFSTPQTFLSVQKDLARCESRSREQWGDALGPSYYQHLHGIDIDVNPEFQPRVVRIESDKHRSDNDAKFPLRGCNQFGRRRSFDSFDCGFEKTPDGNRIVVAGFREATIARNSFTIQILSASRAIIRNNCLVNRLRVMGHEELVYQQEMLVTYPVSVCLPGRTLRIS